MKTIGNVELKGNEPIKYCVWLIRWYLKSSEPSVTEISFFQELIMTRNCCYGSTMRMCCVIDEKLYKEKALPETKPKVSYIYFYIYLLKLTDGLLNTVKPSNIGPKQKKKKYTTFCKKLN